MPVAQRERIMRALIEALEGISVDAGYSTSIRTVVRHSYFDDEEGERPSVRVRWATSAYRDLGAWPSEWGQVDRFFLDCRPQMEEGRSTDELITEFLDDVVRAIGTLEPDEIEASVTGIEASALDVLDSGEPVLGAIVTVTVEYAVDKERPDRVAG